MSDSRMTRESLAITNAQQDHDGRPGIALRRAQLKAACQDLLPGDILGFSAADFLGDAINLATWGLPRWSLSHVAIVARDQQTGRMLLWESTQSCDLPCYRACRRVAGVQCHRIAERVEGYLGRVWHYRLACPLSIWEGGRLSLFVDANLSTSYDEIGAFRSREAGFGWIEARLGEENLHALFCSEFVAAGLREACKFGCRSASRWNPNRLVRTLRAADILLEPRRLK